MRCSRCALVVAALLPIVLAAGCFINRYGSDPNIRTLQLLNESEDLRPIRTGRQHFWFTDQPSHLTPERVHGPIEPAGTAHGQVAPRAGAPAAAGDAGSPQHPEVKSGLGEAEARYAHELLAVLKETKSPDCFVVTLQLLWATDVDPREAVPLILRHAERLGLLGGEAGGGEGQADRTRAVVETVNRLHERRRGPRPAAGAPGAEPPLRMGITTPVPVPPWATERMDANCSAKGDMRTPILPPIRDGVPPPLCQDPPDEADVLRALPPVRGGVPGFYEECRENLQVVTERIVDKIDPPRFFPLVGPARLHHCHWKCTVHFDEITESSYPFPVRIRKPRVEVVYLDRNVVHLYTGPLEAPDKEPRAGPPDRPR